MKRLFAVALVSLLAACSHPERGGVADGTPGLNVAQAALAGGSPAVALNVTDGILAKEPRNVDALVLKGDALTLLDRVADAEDSYRQALIADPGASGAQMGLGRLRLRTSPAEAQALFLDVLRRQPRNQAAMNDLGIAHDLQGEHTAAQEAYRRALGADPAMRAAEVNLAISMALTGKAAAAVPMLRQVASEPDASRRVRQDLAAALALAGDQEGAERILRQDLTPDEVVQVLRGLEALGT